MIDEILTNESIDLLYTQIMLHISSKNVYFRRFTFEPIPKHSVQFEVISVRLEVVRKKLAIKTSLRNSRSRSICRATIVKDNESADRERYRSRASYLRVENPFSAASEISY